MRLIRSFNEDFNESNDFPKEEWEKAIRECFPKCRIEWRDDKVSQLGFGSDLTIITKKGRKYSADVKTKSDRYYHSDMWPLEVVHHIYTDEHKTKKLKTKTGWLYHSTSDLIIFGTKNCTKIIEVCIFSLYPFKDETYKKIFENVQNIWAETKFKNGQYQLTLNKLMTKQMLQSARYYFYKDLLSDN